MISRLMAVLAPSECFGCGREGAVLCADCAADLGHGQQQCFGCGVATVDGRACESCAPRYDLAGVGVAMRYGAAVRRMVLDFKFRRAARVAPAAARLMRGVVPPGEFDLVTSVPIAPVRYRERGYNQSQLIAQALARQLKVPYKTLLGRHGSAHQLGAGRQDRLAQVSDQFFVVRSQVSGRILIIDDVVTTGATLNECARMLRLAGAREVWAAALARR